MRWLRNLWSRFGSSRIQPHRGARPAAPSPRLSLEELEARVLLATWASIGPGSSPVGSSDYTGRVTALAFTQSPLETVANVLLVGSATGGVFTGVGVDKPNVNTTWVPRTDTLPVQDPVTGLGSGAIDVGSIAVDPRNSAVIYVGTGDADSGAISRYGSGILKSTDFGTTFQLVSSGPKNRPDADALPAFFRHSISKIIVDPRNSDRLWASVIDDGTGATTISAPRPSLSSDEGIYFSDNGGRAWRKLTGPQAGGIAPWVEVTDLDYTWGGGTFTLYAGVRNNPYGKGGVWRSTNDGRSWNPLKVGLPTGPSVQRVALAADHTRGSQTVYAAIIKPDPAEMGKASGVLQGVYKTDTRGASWTAISPGSFGDQKQMNNHLALGLNYNTTLYPTGRLYLGGQTKVLEYDIRAGKWQDITTGANGITIHPDQHAFTFGPDGRVYLGNDGGLWRYTPAKSAGTKGPWENMNSYYPGLVTEQVYAASLSPADANTVLVATQDHGTLRTPNLGRKWTEVNGGDGWNVRFAPFHSGAPFAGAIAYGLSNGKGVGLSTDGGRSWTSITPRGDPSKGAEDSVMAVNPRQPSALLVASGRNVWWTPNAFSLGAWAPSWRKIFTGNDEVTALAIGSGRDQLHLGTIRCRNTQRGGHRPSDSTIPRRLKDNDRRDPRPGRLGHPSRLARSHWNCGRGLDPLRPRHDPRRHRQ